MTSTSLSLLRARIFALVHELGADIAKQMATIAGDMSKYDEFVREVSEAVEREAPREEIDALKEKHKASIDKFHETNCVLDKMLEEEIEFELEKFPLEKIPANISGSFLNSIKDMLLY